MSLLAVCFTHCVVCRCCQLLTSLITRPCLILHARTQANVNTSKQNRENTDSHQILLTHSLWPVRLMAVNFSTKLTSISHKDDKQLFFHGERIRKVCFQRFERLQSLHCHADKTSYLQWILDVTFCTPRLGKISLRQIKLWNITCHLQRNLPEFCSLYNICCCMLKCSQISRNDFLFHTEARDIVNCISLVWAHILLYSTLPGSYRIGTVRVLVRLLKWSFNLMTLTVAIWVQL